MHEVRRRYPLFLLTFFVILTFLSRPEPVMALKKRATKTAAPVKAGISYSSARLSRATNSIILSLTNLANVSRVSYELNYTANGKQEGVGGSLAPSGQASDSRDLYFGTCSSGVCTPHRNIKNATLTVTTSLKSGGRYTKRYRIKI